MTPSPAGAATVAEGTDPADDVVELPAPGPDLRLLPAALASWTAAWWATGQAAATALVAALAATALTCMALVRILLPSRRPPRPGAGTGAATAARTSPTAVSTVAAPVAVALAAVAVVLASCASQLARREAGELPRWADERAVATIVGQVAGDPRPVASRPDDDGGRWAVRVLASEVTARGRTQRGVDGAVLVLGGTPWSSAVAGSHVRLTGRLLPPRPGDPTVAAVVAQGSPTVVDAGSWPWRVAERLRAGLRAACADLPPDAAGLLPALVVGDTSRLSPDLRQDLQAAGLTHLTAVSGANCAIVAATVTGCLAVLGAGRRVRVAGTALAIAGFVVLARPEPSVLRAAVMGGVALVGILLARRGAGAATLSTAVVGLLAIDPWLSRSFGFVLSVLATAGLILLVPVWVRRWPLPRALAMALAVPLAAQAVTAPVIVLLQPAISLVGIPANVVAAPAVAPATVAGVVAAAVSPAWPAGAHLVATLAGLPAQWIAEVARRGAEVPGGSLPWLPGRLGALLLAFMVAGAVVASLRSGSPSRRDSRRGTGPPPAGTSPPESAAVPATALPATAVPATAVPATAVPATPVPSAAVPATAVPVTPSRADIDAVRRYTAGGTGTHRWRDRVVPADRRQLAALRWRPGAGTRLPWAAGLLVLAAVLGWMVAPRLVGGGPAEDWSVVQCDVGQGDAMLLRSGPERAVLVDTGPEPSRIDRCLRRWHVAALDLVVLTHFHADHVDGLAGALRNRGRPPVLVSPCPRPAEGFRAAAAAVRASGATMTPATAGTHGRAAGLTWRLLWPPSAETGCRTSGEDVDDGINDSSLVMHADVHGVTVLALGDLETDAQRSLVASLGGVSAVDVVKVAHHGSAKQHAALYAAVRARVALIGVGQDNDYGHPTPSTLAMLEGLGIRVLRTDEQGDLAVVGPSERLAAVTSSRRARRAVARDRGRPGRGPPRRDAHPSWSVAHGRLSPWQRPEARAAPASRRHRRARRSLRTSCGRRLSSSSRAAKGCSPIGRSPPSSRPPARRMPRRRSSGSTRRRTTPAGSRSRPARRCSAAARS
jgi:competence protein ComEC